MESNLKALENKPSEKKWRSGLQAVMPAQATKEQPDNYRIYPYHSLGSGEVHSGYAGLAHWIIEQKTVLIDGYVGVFWHEIQQELHEVFKAQGLSVNWIKMEDHLKPSEEIQDMVKPFIGTLNSVWGTKCRLSLKDFYDLKQNILPDSKFDLNIVVGSGAALLDWQVPLIYVDLPKNELQLRMRAGAITNLGAHAAESAGEMYKRFYFVDWVVLNEHKQRLLERISIVADGQWKNTVNWAFANDFKAGLRKLSQSVFRVRPWFEPGAWGGQWMKERIEGLNKEDVNLAWSFELIVPENGIVFESNGNLLEVSFDFLMFQENEAVLGKDAKHFGFEFPIRFDFLDTWDGGNLSIQCHPALSYIRERFGEYITQDETYYMLDCQENAQVYLGFQEDIQPISFRQALEESRDEKKKIDIEQYVQAFNAKKHDLFLIPNGTVHSAGAGNLVLEISATPYIFTFKMYDWLRLDLNGEPRAINIEHAFNNLNFNRKGNKVQEELISKPRIIEEGADWKLIHLPTHAEHFYDIERIEFDTKCEVDTKSSFHALMLVEGTSITVRTADGTESEFFYAETFVIPAAAEHYTLINTGNGRAKLVKAFVKENIDSLIK